MNEYVHKKLSSDDSQRVKSLIEFLAGYTSELSLEILATVDFILTSSPKATLDEVMQALATWNMRKKELFKREYVEASYDYLKKYATSFN